MNHWTDDELDRLRHMRCTLGYSQSEIAHRMPRRTQAAIESALRKRHWHLPDGMTRGLTMHTSIPLLPRDRWPHQQALQDAWHTGAAIRTTARVLSVTEETVRHAYEWFGHDYAMTAPAYAPTGYIGAPEMARMLAPVYCVSPRAVLGATRHKPAVAARSVIARVLRDRGRSLVAVARAVGRSDHSTVLHLLARYERDRHAQQVRRELGL